MSAPNEELVERVNALADRLEDLEDPDAIDYLDATVTADLDGTLREVGVTLGTGGPHLELNTTQGWVQGFWAGDEHRVPVNSEAVRQLDDRLRRQWQHAEPEA